MIIYSRIVLKVKSSKLKIICYNAFHYILQGIYTINKTPKTYIPTHMLNIYIKQYYRTTN